jgi:ribosomal protein L5
VDFSVKNGGKIGIVVEMTRILQNACHIVLNRLEDFKTLAHNGPARFGQLNGKCRT